MRNKLACLLLVFALCSGSLPAQAQSGVVAGWKQALDEAEAHLDREKWAKAYKKSDRVLQEMIYSIQKGTRVAEMFGRVFKIQALAKEGMGDSCEAAWNWDAAQQLTPDIQRSSTYKIFEPIYHTDADGCSSSPWPEVDEARCLEVLSKIETPVPKSEVELLAARARVRYLGRPVMIIVQTLINTEGRLCGNQILLRNSQALDPVLAASIFWALRQRTFEPARLDGEPVPIAYNFTTIFSPPDELTTRIESWRETLKAAERDLREQRWDAAHEKGDRVAMAILKEAPGGQYLEEMLANTFFIQALAEAGRGSQRMAHWNWKSALQLDPQVEKIRLEPYGEAGRLLRKVPVEDLSGISPGLEIREMDDDEIEPPIKEYAPRPVYPEGLTDTPKTAKVVVKVVVGSDGRLWLPDVLRGRQEPHLVFSVLAAARHWRFEPAKLEGEPIPVTFDLAVNFSTR